MKGRIPFPAARTRPFSSSLMTFFIIACKGTPFFPFLNRNLYCSCEKLNPDLFLKNKG
jgi:hypothetical protein